MSPETPQHEAQMEDISKRVNALDESDGAVDGNLGKSKEAKEKVHALMDRVKVELESNNEDVRKGWEKAVQILFSGLNQLNHSEKWSNVQAYQKQIDLFIHNLESIVGKTPGANLETKAKDLDTHERDLAMYCVELSGEPDVSPARKRFAEETVKMQYDTEGCLDVDRSKLQTLKHKNPDAEITDTISEESRMQLLRERDFYAKNSDQWKDVSPGDTAGTNLKEFTEQRLLFVESLIGNRRLLDPKRPEALSKNNEPSKIDYQKLAPQVQNLLSIFSHNSSMPGESITVSTACDAFQKALQEMHVGADDAGAAMEALTKELKNYNYGTTEKGLWHLSVMAAGKEPMLRVGAAPGEIVRLKFDQDAGQVTYTSIGKPKESLASQKQRRGLQTETTEQSKRHVEETKQQTAVAIEEKKTAEQHLQNVEKAHTTEKEVEDAQKEVARADQRVQELEKQEQQESRRVDQSRNLEYADLVTTAVDESDGENSPIEKSERAIRQRVLEQELGISNDPDRHVFRQTHKDLLPKEIDQQELEQASNKDFQKLKKLPGKNMWELEGISPVSDVTAQYRGGKWYVGLEVGGRTQFFRATPDVYLMFREDSEGDAKRAAIKSPALKQTIDGLKRSPRFTEVSKLVGKLTSFNA